MRLLKIFPLPFKIFPLPFWCYMIPMAASTLGLIPASHPIYSLASQQLLPVCLALLLIGTDLRGIARLGPKAISLMLAGSLGTILGALVSFRLYRAWLPPDSWAGIGALAASWIGGSANLIAVKEALQAPDSLMAPIILVDATLAYTWMALLLWASGCQVQWDRTVTRSLGYTVPTRPPHGALVGNPIAGTLPGSVRLTQLFIAIGLSVAISIGAQLGAKSLPEMGHVVSVSTWIVLLATTIALILSLTPLRKLEEAGASKVGAFLLYILLATIGARGNFRAIAEAPIFLALGATWIFIHGATLIVVGYLLKAPLGVMATASQANIGGPISAPLVGATYHPQLATVGLLMAILGNILGTYLGLATAFFLRYN